MRKIIFTDNDLSEEVDMVKKNHGTRRRNETKGEKKNQRKRESTLGI